MFVPETFVCAAHPGAEIRKAESMSDETINNIDLDEETSSLSRQLHHMRKLTNDDAQ